MVVMLDGTADERERVCALLADLLRNRASHLDTRIIFDATGITVRYADEVPAGKGRRFPPLFRLEYRDSQWLSFRPGLNNSWELTAAAGGLLSAILQLLDIHATGLNSEPRGPMNGA